MALIGSILPDCDIKGSPAGKVIPLWLIPGVHHRGGTHSAFMLVLLSAIVGLFNIYGGLGLFFGYGVGHLLLDSLTPTGLPNLKYIPFRKKGY